MNEIKKLLLNQGKTATIEGVPPLTLERSLGKDLKDYKIYGKTQQGKNLLTYPFFHTTKTENGLTYTDNGDGSLTVKGTATASTYFTINKGLDLGKDHITETVGTNGEYALSKKLRYNANIQTVSIEFKAGTVVDETFYPQAEKGTISTEYEQPSYFVSPEKPIEIESVGDKTVNLADLSSATNSNFVDNGDGSYTLTKVSSSNRYSEKIYCNIPANTTFYLKAKILEFTGTYSQKLQLTAKLTDGSTKYLNNAVNDIQGKYTYTADVDYFQIYSDNSNPIGSYVTFKDFIISTEDVPYEPYGKYKIPVLTKGANLLDYRTFISRNQSLYPLKINDDGSLEYTGNYYITADGSFMTKGKTYVFDFKYESEIVPVLRLQYTDGTYTSTFRMGNSVTPAKEVSTIMLYTEFTEVIHYLKIWDLILVDGTDIKDYEPYIEPTKTKIFLNEPLRKAGDYADCIDFGNGKIVRNIKEVLLNGSDEENWRIQSTNTYGIANFYTSIVGNILSTQFISNRFKRQTTQIASTQTEGMLHANAETFYFRVKTERASNVDELKEWLKINNTSLVAILLTPIEESIVLPKIPTHKGTTIIELDTKINASNMMTKYKRR